MRLWSCLTAGGCRAERESRIPLGPGDLPLARGRKVQRHPLTGLAFLAALLHLVGLPPSAAPAASTSLETNTSPRSHPYTRVVHPDTNTVELQIAMRRFQRSSRNSPNIWLVAVSHIGETNYYQRIQTFLESQALVLFEGVGDPEAFKTPAPHSPDHTPMADQSRERETGSLQSTLADSLDLAFQLTAIDYSRPHFHNSDLSLEQIQTLLMTHLQEGSENSDGGMPNPAFLALIQAMDGTSWLGTLLHMGVKLVGSSPKLKAMTRLMFIEILGRLEGDLTQIQGLPPDMKDLLRVLIRERNKVVLRDLQSALRKKSPPQSVAILYGAGHMDDLEKRLAAELKYFPVQDTWLPAITVRPLQSGLTAAEIQMIRSLVQWQMDAFKQEWGNSSSQP